MKINLGQLTLGKGIALILVSAISLAIALLNAAFTYTYGADVIGGFLLASVVGGDTAEFISGMTAVLFFDAGYVMGLVAFIWLSDTFMQKAVLAVQTVACFCFSVGASVIGIIVLSDLSASIPPLLLLAARYSGGAILILAFVINAAAGVGLVIFHPAVSAQLRETTRRAKEIQFMGRMIDQLDDQTYSQAEKEVMADVPVLAGLRSADVRDGYLHRLGFQANQLPTPRPAFSKNGLPVKVEQTAPAAPILDGRANQQPAYRVCLNNYQRMVRLIHETYDWVEADSAARATAESAPPDHWVTIILGEGIVAHYDALPAVEFADDDDVPISPEDAEIVVASHNVIADVIKEGIRRINGDARPTQRP